MALRSVKINIVMGLAGVELMVKPGGMKPLLRHAELKLRLAELKLMSWLKLTVRPARLKVTVRLAD